MELAAEIPAPEIFGGTVFRENDFVIFQCFVKQVILINTRCYCGNRNIGTG
jgi:hypothetical protein